MIAATWILLRTSVLKLVAPLMSIGCMLLVSANINSIPDSMMRASSEAAFAVMVWAPASTFLAYLSIRSAGLRRTPDLLALGGRASHVRRAASALAAPTLWACLGWCGFWAGCSALASAKGIYPVMIANGLALSILATVIGSLIAIVEAPAWVAALGAGGVFVGLAVWSYLPETTASILFSPYTPMFFTSARPSPEYLGIQILWALAVFATLLLACSKILRPSLAVAVVSMVAVTTIWAAGSVDHIKPQASGRADGRSPSAGPR